MHGWTNQTEIADWKNAVGDEPCSVCAVRAAEVQALGAGPLRNLLPLGAQQVPTIEGKAEKEA